MDPWPLSISIYMYPLPRNLTPLKFTKRSFETERKDCKNAASAWSRDGKIFVKRASDEKIFKIVSTSDFLQKTYLILHIKISGLVPTNVL
jgi:hypothetical protein